MKKILFLFILILFGLQWQEAQAQQIDHGITISHHIIDEQVKVAHTSMLLFHLVKCSYNLSVCKGAEGV